MSAEAGTPGLGRAVARGAIVNASASLVAALAFGLRALVAALFMAPEAVAVWTICSLILITMTVLRGAGVTERFVQEQHATPRVAFGEAYSVSLVVSCSLGLLVAATAPLVALAYDDPRLTWPLAAVGGLIALDGLKFQTAWYYRDLQFGRQRTLQLLDAIGGVVLAVPLLALGAEWWGLLAAAGAASIVTIAVAWSMGPRPTLRPPTAAVVRRYAAFSGPVLATAVIGIVLGHAGNLALRHAAGIAALGWLGLGAICFSACERLSGVMNQSVFPALCRSPGASVVRAVQVMQRLSWAFAAPVAFFVCALADWGVPAALGERWEGAGPVVAALAFAAVLRQFGFPYGVVVMASGNTSPLMRYGILYGVTFVVVLLPATLLGGSDGYAVGTIVVELVLAARRWHILRRALPDLRLAERVLGDLLAAALPGALALASLGFTGGADAATRFAVALVAAACGASALVVRHRSLVATVLGFVREGPPVSPSPPAPPVVTAAVR